MDLLWFKRYRDEGGTSTFPFWEFGSTVDGFEDAPAPAKVGQIAARAVNVELPDSTAGLTNSVVHWATGISWGVTAATLRSLRVGPIRSGLIGGVAAWTTSYVVLPQVGVYKPITEYDSIRVLPFGGKVVKATITGALLQRVLQIGEQNRGTGGYLHTSGIPATIDPAARYTLAISDFLLTGGEANLGFLTRRNPEISDITDLRDIRLALIDEIKRRWK